MSPQESFKSPLRVEYLDGERWKLLEEFSYVRPNGDVFIVTAGFETDFASIPRFFWRIFPPTGKWGKAAVVHDFLYYTGIMPRAEADKVFLEGMEDLGVPWLTRRLMYRAVRVGGGGAWEAHRKRQRSRLRALQERARRKHGL